jgi:hypothetical protein
MTDRNHTLTDEKIERYGRTFYRIRHADGREGGWAETLDSIPPGSTAEFYGDALCFKWGKFCGGVFYGGKFWGGEFYGGDFQDGEFYGGTFQDGTFQDGKFYGGEFYGGEFYTSPCCAQRSDGYMFVAKYVDDDLRIWAGCRNFSWDEAVAHWNDDHERGAESQRIIHFLKAQAEAERDRDAKREKTDD